MKNPTYVRPPRTYFYEEGMRRAALKAPIDSCPWKETTIERSEWISGWHHQTNGLIT